MKKIALIFTAILLLVSSALAAPAQPDALLGQPMNDFSFIDTEGQVYTLSALLKEKKIVVISLFASWCPPCKAEFPAMQKVRDRHEEEVSVLALSAYEGDTMEDMAAFKAEYAPGLPFGLTEGTGILDQVLLSAYPTNLIIDRFGNIGYAMAGAFPNEVSFERTVRAFLGDDYSETRTLSGPKYGETEIRLLSEGAREADIIWQGAPTGLRFSILEDSEAVFALHASEDFDPTSSCIRNLMTNEATPLAELALTDGVYRYTCENAMDGSALILSFEASYYGAVETSSIIVVRGEENAEVVLAPYIEAGYDVSWAYVAI